MREILSDQTGEVQNDERRTQNEEEAGSSFCILRSSFCVSPSTSNKVFILRVGLPDTEPSSSPEPEADENGIHQIRR
jgi:hypothetical protein